MRAFWSHSFRHAKALMECDFSPLAVFPSHALAWLAGVHHWCVGCEIQAPPGVSVPLPGRSFGRVTLLGWMIR